MAITNEPSTTAIIQELLQQNKKLRLELAVLLAEERKIKEINEAFQKSQNGLTPEIISQISPAALEALQTMEFR